MVRVLAGGATDTLSWTDAAQNESTIIGDPTGSQANRLVFLSVPLRKPLRISGTPVLDVQASLSTTQSNVGAVLVDYGPSTQITRSSDGILDSSNRESLLAGAATPVAIGSRYQFAWATFPNDFVFAAGHRIGIILVANYTSFSSLAGATGSTVTPDTRVSKVRLPIVGGYGVAVASGGFAGSQ